jgi:hypothetical protein
MVITKAKSYPKMPTGVQTRARAASGDDGAVFDLIDPVLWELDPTGNILRKVAAAGEEVLCAAKDETSVEFMG